MRSVDSSHLGSIRRRDRKGFGTASADPLSSDTFEVIAREWFAKYSPAWAPGHGDKIIRRLESNVFPWLGERQIRDIKPVDLLAVIQRIEQRGRNETAHRALQNCGRVFRYAIASGRAERDITRDLPGALAPIVERHHASIVEPKAVGALLRAAYNYAKHLPERRKMMQAWADYLTGLRGAGT